MNVQQIQEIKDIRTGELRGYALRGKGFTAHVTLEVWQDLGGDPERVYEAVHALHRDRFLPRLGSVACPLTRRAIELARRNQALGRRHWRWFQRQGPQVRAATGNDSVWGYGYEEPDGTVVLVDEGDQVIFRVPPQQ